MTVERKRKKTGEMPERRKSENVSPFPERSDRQESENVYRDGLVAMFKRGWFNRGRIRSDTGYDVTFLGRAHLEYKEGKRKTIIGGERLTDGFVIDIPTIIAWDDGKLIDEATRWRIIEKIKRALESQGMIVDLDPGMGQDGTGDA